jgi:Nucleotidyl transferase AbiEii toxin, Type IV TA system
MTASTLDSRSIHEVYAEGLRYFMGEGTLQGTLAQVASDLKQCGIDYMVIGAVALMAYGYPRFTEDIDLVLTKEGLETFHRELIGLGYVPAFSGAKKRLRSTRDNVPIEVIVAGEYPGDGKPKPVSFPVPADSSTEIDGVRVVTLEKLIELKLASGMTAPDRLKDLADVQELIKARGITSDFAQALNPYVREKFLELYRAVEQAGHTNDIKE